MVTDTFTEKATANACTVHGPFPPADAATRLVDVVIGHAATGEVAIPEGDALVDQLELPDRLASAGVRLLQPGDDRWETRLADAAVGVTSATIAVASTGTVAVTAGPGAPRALSLLPPVHVCVLRASDVVAEFAEAIVQVGERSLPSALIWVGGPSRTADLEMIQTLGVHGPKIVELVLLSG